MADTGDYNRPRRPNPETIAYLKSLPLDLRASKEEIQTFLEQKGEFPTQLTAALSAIDEIRHEIASLAGDEEASQILETMAHIAVPHSETAARIMLYGLMGYNLHLATHRYGSHVVQTILQLSVWGSEEDLSSHEDAPQLSTDDVASMQELISGMVEELSPTASQLAVHVCGSHVMRSLVCVLGGVKLQQQGERRGREKSKKKKKKSKMADEAGLQGKHAGIMELDYSQSGSRVKMQIDSLNSLMESLWGSQQHGELQQMACHPSAGPLLMIFLRVLTFACSADREQWQQSHEIDAQKEKDNFRLGIFKVQPRFALGSPAHDFVKRLLLLETEDKIGEVIYGMSGEPRGSHVLETLMHISPDEVFQIILDKGDFVSSMQEYVEHDVSNFVVQALFTTVRTKEQAEILLKAVEKLISSGLVVDSAKRRVGIFWRTAELASNFRVQQEPILKALRIGTGIAMKQDYTEPEETDEGQKKKQRQKASSVPLQECIMPLLNLKAPEQHGGHVTLGVEGTRAVYYLLRFAPRLCGDILDGITEKMSQEELELLATDGLGSRCVWDGILDGPMDEKPFLRAARNLLSKLSGRWVALASDRVGQHCVMKLFRVLKLQDKATLTAELANGSNRLGGSAMGRNVMEACAVSAFLQGENAWNDAVRKLEKKDTWLDDLIEPAESEGNKKERKRKRKKNTNDSDEPKKSKPSAVDAIFDTITRAIKPTKAAE